MFALVVWFLLGLGTAEAAVKRISFDPLVILSEDDSCRMMIEVSADIVSVRIPGHAQIGQNGRYLTTIECFDDGLRGDDVAGDHIFTASEVHFGLIDASTPRYQAAVSIWYGGLDLELGYADGRIEKIYAELRMPLRVLRRDAYTPPAMRPLAADAVLSSHCLSLVVQARPPELEVADSVVARRYYELMPDDRDFLVIEDLFQRPGSSVAGYFMDGDDRNTGWGPHSDCCAALFGSDGRLQGVVRTLSALNSGLLNHELLHRWASGRFPELGWGGHWRAIQRPSTGFGPYWGAYESFEHLGGNQYRATGNSTGFEFSDIELYLMGLLAPNQVAWPVHYLQNAQEIATNYKPGGGFTRDFTADGIAVLTQASFESKYGARNPDSTQSQKQFTMGTVIAYHRLLNPVEIAFFNHIMREYGMPASENPAFYPFATATRGYGSMITSMPPPRGETEPVDPQSLGLEWMKRAASGIVSLRLFAPQGRSIALEQTEKFDSWRIIYSGIATNNPMQLDVDAGPANTAFFRLRTDP